MIKIFNLLTNIVFKKKQPVSIVHFLTNRCNARCSFCFINFSDNKIFQNELNLYEIDKLTKKLGSSIRNVSFTGGEPFARKDILEIAKLYIKNSLIQSIYITTNGSLPERILAFAKNINAFNKNIELNFQISIDHFPDKHDKIRKIPNLFKNCLTTYFSLRELNIPQINSNVAITVSEENYQDIEGIYNYLYYRKRIKHIKAILVRDEGIYKNNISKKKLILDAYKLLTNKIIKNLNVTKNNFNEKSLQGKIHQQKDIIAFRLIKKIAQHNKYISPCHAASLFGIITAQGDVYPCEILENKKIGSLRDVNMDFIKLWNSKKNFEIKKDILNNKCFCTYECGMSFNIIGNYRYYFDLALGLFK